MTPFGVIPHVPLPTQPPPVFVPPFVSVVLSLLADEEALASILVVEHIAVKAIAQHATKSFNFLSIVLYNCLLKLCLLSFFTRLFGFFLDRAWNHNIYFSNTFH